MLQGKQVLIVDDMLAVRKSMAKHVEALGGKALLATDAESALMMLADHHVDAFLLDIHLSGMDGMALCRRIRTMVRFQYTPIIFITSLAQADIATEAFASGGDDIVCKPPGKDIFNARLSYHLTRCEKAREKEAVQQGLNKYLDSRTREAVAAQVGAGELLQPQRREVCVLFTDVRGFTQLSQGMDPQQLFDILSEHLNAQVQAVYRYRGYIDKFSGDGLMAVFDQERACVDACRCALDVVDYAREHAEGDKTALHQLGIGIHYGEVMAGNIGRERQMDYTVVGPTVNLAARLCGHAEAMSVVVSEQVKEKLLEHSTALERFDFSQPRQLQVKGVSKAVAAYTLERAQKTFPKSRVLEDY